MCCVTLVGAAISCVFIFQDNVGVLLGWLLGSAVNLFSYFTIYKGASYLISNSTSSKQGYLSMVWGMLRFLLYAGVLLLSGFASFKWGSLSHGYCNFIAAALALMPTWITLVITMFFRAKKAETPTPKEDKQPQEEENGEPKQ